MDGSRVLKTGFGCNFARNPRKPPESSAAAVSTEKSRANNHIAGEFSDCSGTATEAAVGSVWSQLARIGESREYTRATSDRSCPMSDEIRDDDDSPQPTNQPTNQPTDRPTDRPTNRTHTLRHRYFLHTAKTIARFRVNWSRLSRVQQVPPRVERTEKVYRLEPAERDETKEREREREGPR